MFRSKNWSNLPGDVWFAVGLRLNAASDRIRFRAVSKSLRSHLPFRQPPWLMLSEVHHDDSDCDDSEEETDSEEENEVKPALPPPKRRFVILGEQSIYEFDLPQVYQARCLGSTNTWLIISKFEYVKTNYVNQARLLNPFSKLELHLPSQITFNHQIFFLTRFLLSALHSVRHVVLHKSIICPSTSDGIDDFLVITIERGGILAMARPGDLLWTAAIVETELHTGVIDMVVFKQTLFAINTYGLLLSCDIRNYRDSNSPSSLTVVGQPFDKFQLHSFNLGDPSPFEMLYLVEWCGHLLLVIKFIIIIGTRIVCYTVPVGNYKTERFQVYKFDFTNGNWIEIDSLGEYSLFLGKNTSVSVLASEYFGLVKKNCIYFSDDFHFGYHGIYTPGRCDEGVFDLDDNSVTPNYQATSISFSPPPIWIFPN